MSSRREFTAGERASVDIETRSGSVDVRVAAGNGIVVSTSGDAGDAGDVWEITQLGDVVSIRPASRWPTRSTRVLVEVPPGTAVEVRSAAADVALSGALGAATIRSASGDVRIESVTALDVSTASGDVRVASVGADVRTATVSGDIDLDTVAGRLAATTTSGDVRGRHLAGDATIVTASGNVRIDRYDGSLLAVKSVSGDVHIGLPSGIRVEPDISTLAGKTKLPPATPADDAPRRHVRLRLRTVSGDITIMRAT